MQKRGGEAGLFSKRTVFVIGAGCSMEFAFPSGPVLMEHIYNNARTAAQSGDSLLRAAYVRSGIDNVDVSGKFASFARGLLGWPSIDQYLERHSETPWLVQMGRLAIAQVILGFERQSGLDRVSIATGLPPHSGHWIGALFRLLLPQSDPSDPMAWADNVSFVCFNYDRCIEVFLYNALRNATHLEPEAIAPHWKRLNVWHPYGTVGDYDPLSAGGRSAVFGFDRAFTEDEYDLVEASKRLRTFGEGMTDQPAQDQMLTAIREAEQIVFLGFSYGADNMHLLTPGDRLQADLVVANAYKLSDSNISLAREACAEMLGGEAPNDRDRVAICENTATEFITQYGPALSAGVMNWQWKQGQLHQLR